MIFETVLMATYSWPLVTFLPLLLLLSVIVVVKYWKSFWLPVWYSTIALLFYSVFSLLGYPSFDDIEPGIYLSHRVTDEYIYVWVQHKVPRAYAIEPTQDNNRKFAEAREATEEGNIVAVRSSSSGTEVEQLTTEQLLGKKDDSYSR